MRKQPSASKSALAHDISTFLLKYLTGFRIPTYLVGMGDSEGRMEPQAMIPLEVSVWNVATDDYAKRFGLRVGAELMFPVIEHRYKRPDLRSPMLNEFHIYSLGLANPQQLQIINRLASKANIVLRSFFERRGLKLNRLGLEFIIVDNQIMIGGEISPRTCSISDLKKQNGRKMSRHAARQSVALKSTDPTLFGEIHNRVCRTHQPEYS